MIFPSKLMQNDLFRMIMAPLIVSVSIFLTFFVAQSVPDIIAAFGIIIGSFLLFLCVIPFLTYSPSTNANALKREKYIKQTVADLQAVSVHDMEGDPWKIFNVMNRAAALLQDNMHLYELYVKDEEGKNS